jgi:flagellar biosynthesis/type III secretory pathway protein FliH
MATISTSTLSQREYDSGEFCLDKWPCIGEAPTDDIFTPEKVQVASSTQKKDDPMFLDFGGKVTPSHAEWYVAATREEQEAEARKHSVEPSEPTMTILISEYESALDGARHEAFAQGEVHAREELETKLHAQSQEIATLIDSVRSELVQRFQEIEVAALELTLLLSERVLHLVVDVNPLAITGIVREALRHLHGSKALRVAVPEAYYDIISQGMKEDGAPDDMAKLEFVPDESLTLGCRIESTGGSVEVELDKALGAIRSALSE